MPDMTARVVGAGHHDVLREMRERIVKAIAKTEREQSQLLNARTGVLGDAEPCRQLVSEYRECLAALDAALAAMGANDLVTRFDDAGWSARSFNVPMADTGDVFGCVEIIESRVDGAERTMGTGETFLEALCNAFAVDSDPSPWRKSERAALPSLGRGCRWTKRPNDSAAYSHSCDGIGRIWFASPLQNLPKFCPDCGNKVVVTPDGEASDGL